MAIPLIGLGDDPVEKIAGGLLDAMKPDLWDYVCDKVKEDLLPGYTIVDIARSKTAADDLLDEDAIHLDGLCGD